MFIANFNRIFHGHAGYFHEYDYLRCILQLPNVKHQAFNPLEGKKTFDKHRKYLKSDSNVKKFL